MPSALLVNGVPIECINQAAIQYQIPATLIVSILGVEGGKVGMASRNKNGTYDYGPMQINTVWLDVIKPYGYTQEQIQYDPCVNVWVGSWILSQRIASSNEFWRGVAGYHSFSLPQNTTYKYKVLSLYNTLDNYLRAPDINALNQSAVKLPNPTVK